SRPRYRPRSGDVRRRPERRRAGRIELSGRRHARVSGSGAADGAGLYPIAYRDPRATLAVLEVGLPLLDEGRHAFLLIFRGEQRIELAPLEPRAFGERRGEAAIDRLLDHHHRVLREIGDL